MKLVGFFPLYTLGLFLASQLFADTVESDVCVYGGTSGGVIAAVQAARMGKTVTRWWLLIITWVG